MKTPILKLIALAMLLSAMVVSGAYHRLAAAGQPDRAHNVAVAFRRPNFEYAYNKD